MWGYALQQRRRSHAVELFRLAEAQNYWRGAAVVREHVAYKGVGVGGAPKAMLKRCGS